MCYLSYGVPQGSILGPLLFLIYINDLASINSFIKFIMYADDCSIYASGANIREIITRANQELIIINSWIKCNKLTLNMDKTHYIIFNRNKTLPFNLDQLKIDSTPVVEQSSTKFLGVFLDKKLSWKDHINHVQAKINKQCGIIYQVRGLLSTKALRLIYYSLVYPIITYCHVVWGAATQTALKPVIIAQKKIIRAIMGLRKFDHTNKSFS